MKQEWQLKVRLPMHMRDGLYLIAKNNERSINYLIVKAVTEFIARNSEAPTAVTVRASDVSISSKENRHDKYSNS
ncbi:Arc family DNA-binding protein [Entomohabitans teleogrylli]|uniref:Arc family DNA-binding protein n=1 Tax=Entomohabitans teleogrylli TaxID=1384589 RepID=UPI0008FCA9E0|nr:Arc family DNA-binding protein [Entomohabitans teleogrylli]